MARAIPLFAHYAAQHHIDVASAADFARLKQRFSCLSATDLAQLKSIEGSDYLNSGPRGFGGFQLYARWHMDDYTGRIGERMKRLHAAYAALTDDDKAALSMLARRCPPADRATKRQRAAANVATRNATRLAQQALQLQQHGADISNAAGLAALGDRCHKAPPEGLAELPTA